MPPAATPALVGIDWGTTHRRAVLLARDGAVLAERVDAEGALACAGRFGTSLEALLEALLAAGPAIDGDVPVLMAGMVGSAIGWQVVPYLDAGTPLVDLGRHLVPVADAPPARRWWLVPGMAWHGEGGTVDVMRGEETQLFGALAQAGRGDGLYVLPGTHSKWCRVVDGRVVALRTYLTGELFALLRQHGTLASAMQATAGAVAGPVDPADPAFLQGVDAAMARPALAHALFGARARVVTGAMPATAAAAYVSGLLVGAEWADAARLGGIDGPVRLVGDPGLAALHGRCAARLGRVVEALDVRQVQLAAWRGLAAQLAGTAPMENRA